MEQRLQRKMQVSAAALGAAVLLAMGVITAAGRGDAVITFEPPTGDTTTPTTPPSTPSTTKATPSVTASTSQGEWPETMEVEPG